jgi:hypothetical protein
VSQARRVCGGVYVLRMYTVILDVRARPARSPPTPTHRGDTFATLIALVVAYDPAPAPPRR